MIRQLRLTHILTAVATVIVFVACVSCAPKHVSGRIEESPEAAWQAFRNRYCVPPAAPGLFIKSSLYYTRVKPTRRTNRTLMSLWGDFEGPMRLDLAAGMGKLLAHIREDENGLLVVYPTEKRAYAHRNAVLGATRLGMPFPFSLTQLALVVSGDFSGLAPASFADATRSGKGYVFTVDHSLTTRITLDDTGSPILLEGRTTKAYDSTQGWRVEINTYEEGAKGAPLPVKLTVSLENGEQGILNIKSRDLKQEPWPAKATELALPDGIEFHRLDNGAEPVENSKIPIVHEDKS